MNIQDYIKNPVLAIGITPDNQPMYFYETIQAHYEIPCCAQPHARRTQFAKWRLKWEHSVAQFRYQYQWDSVPDTRQYNQDIPHVQAFVDMGIADINPNLPASIDKEWRDSHGVKRTARMRTMNDAHFRELCVVRGNQLHALHEKSRGELQKPWHLRPETWQRWLECDYADAATLAEAFTKFSATPDTVRKAVFGYLGNDGQWRTGIKAANDPEYFAAYFENLAEKADGPTASLELYRTQAREEIEAQYGSILTTTQVEIAAEQRAQARWREHLETRQEIEDWLTLDENTNKPISDLRKSWEIFEDEDLEDFAGEFAEDPAFDSRTSNPYSTHPLYDESESLDYGFTRAITEASYDELSKLKSMMYSQNNKPAQFGFFTPSQVKHFWTCINAQEQAIIVNAMQHCPEDVWDTFLQIKNAYQGGPKQVRRVRARMLSHVNGGTFNNYGYEIKYEQPSLEHQALLKWAYKTYSRPIKKVA